MRVFILHCKYCIIQSWCQLGLEIQDSRSMGTLGAEDTETARRWRHWGGGEWVSPSQLTRRHEQWCNYCFGCPVAETMKCTPSLKVVVTPTVQFSLQCYDFSFYFYSLLELSFFLQSAKWQPVTGPQKGMGESLNFITCLQGQLCDVHKTGKIFLGTSPKYTQKAASTNLLIAFKMHQNLQIWTLYFKIFLRQSIQAPYSEGLPHSGEGHMQAPLHTPNPHNFLVSKPWLCHWWQLANLLQNCTILLQVNVENTIDCRPSKWIC